MDTASKKSKVSMMTMKSSTQTKSIVNVADKSMSRLKVRKQSYGFSRVPGISAGKRSSQVLWLPYLKSIRINIPQFILI